MHPTWQARLVSVEREDLSCLFPAGASFCALVVHPDHPLLSRLARRPHHHTPAACVYGSSFQHYCEGQRPGALQEQLLALYPTAYSRTGTQPWLLQSVSSLRVLENQ